MKAYLLASVAAAFTSETCEVVTVGGVRVNKADYEADQEKPVGERQYKGKLDKEAAQPEQTAGVQLTGGDPAPAAPSAPDSSGGDNAAPMPIDPLKQAAAPVTASPNQRLVMKKGSKYIVVDGTGQPVEMDGIEKGGYKTEEAAWNAIRALPH